MITNAITLLILCAFAFVPLLLGEFARDRSVPDTKDFILQGRKLKLFPMYATVFATWMSVFAFMGGVAYFYEQGPIYMTTVGWDALFAVLFVIIGKRLWYYSKVHNYFTPSDFFRDIYESKALEILVTSIIIICTMLYLQVQIVGGLLVMRIATGGIISWYVGGVIFFSILVIYLWAGGLRAVALTDIFYGICIVLAILSSGFFLMHIAGGPEAVFDELIKRDPSNVALTGPTASSRTLMWLAMFVIVPVGAFMGPQMWIRNYASASEDNFNALPWLLCLSSIICLGTLFSGSAGAVLVENTDNPDSILLTLMKEHANTYFYIFIIVGIYATIFSTANSQVHALSAVYTIDIHKRFINRKAPEKKLVSVAKWAVLIISMVSYILIIIMPQSIFDLAIASLGGMAQLIVPVIGALFWKRSTARAAVTGIVVGEMVFCAGVVIRFADVSVCGLLALGLNLLMFLTVSLADKPRIRVYKKIETYRNNYLGRK